MDDLFNFGGIDGNILGDGIATSPSNNSLTKQDSHTSNKSSNSEQKDNKNKPFKVVIVGDPQVGKTSFLTKHLNGSFDPQYRATVGASTIALEFNTNLQSYTFDVRDVAGQNLFAGKRDEFYQDIDGAIIMYDVMNWASYDNVTDVWLKEINDKAPSKIPIVIVGNKMENRQTRAVSVEVVAELIQSKLEKDGIGYCEVSVKTNQNLAEPFLFLTKKLLGILSNNALYFVSKISELNLIESMLQHQKSKDDQTTAMQSEATTSTNLDNLFLTENVGTKEGDDGNATGDNLNGNGNAATSANQGADYLDDVIFNIGSGDGNDEKQKGDDHISSNGTPQNVADDAFFGDMMTNKSQSSNKTTPVSASTKSEKSIPRQSPRDKHVASSQQIKSSGNTKRANAVSPGSGARSKTAVRPQAQQQSRVQQRDDTANGMIVELLLGIQTSLNGLTTEVRRLQKDVNFLKQQQQQRHQRR